jgi:hypothetical protein
MELESNVQMPVSPGTISLLWCRATTAATSSSTVTLRKNGANANNTISINANTTGAFSDTPHNDSIATGDLIAVKVVAGSSAPIIDIIACTFAASPSSNTVTRLGGMDEVPNAPSGPATWFMPSAGVDADSGSFITSETSGVKLRHRKAMTVKNLAAYFFNSGDPDTVTSRKVPSLRFSTGVAVLTCNCRYL